MLTSLAKPAGDAPLPVRAVSYVFDPEDVWAPTLATRFANAVVRLDLLVGVPHASQRYSSLLVVFMGRNAPPLGGLSAEMLAAGIPQLVVSLNACRVPDRQRCPPQLLSGLSLHIAFEPGPFRRAILEWPGFAANAQRGDSEPCFYSNDVYEKPQGNQRVVGHWRLPTKGTICP